jgi:hypothetical protein
MAAMRLRLAAVVVTTALLASGSARADHDAAVRLFDEGRKLRDDKQFANAARAFEKSIKEEESIGAYYNLGLVNESMQNWREALVAYRRALALAQERKDNRDKDALAAIGLILDKQSYVTVKVSDAISQIQGLKVVLDGTDVPPKEFNGEVFRKSTNHTLVVIAPGHNQLPLSAKNHETITVVLGDAINESPTPPPPIPDKPGKRAEPGLGWQKPTGIALLGIGVVGAVIGIVFTADFFSTRSDLRTEFETTCKTKSNNPCGTTEHPTDTFRDISNRLDDNVTSAAIKQSIAYGIAGLALLGGTYLLVTAPSLTKQESPPAPSTGTVHFVPQIGTHESGLFAVGTF